MSLAKGCADERVTLVSHYDPCYRKRRWLRVFFCYLYGGPVTPQLPAPLLRAAETHCASSCRPRCLLATDAPSHQGRSVTPPAHLLISLHGSLSIVNFVQGQGKAITTSPTLTVSHSCCSSRPRIFPALYPPRPRPPLTLSSLSLRLISPSPSPLGYPQDPTLSKSSASMRSRRS